jgi:peptidoglycan/LPS O-acetylase OafA/YrhL
VLLENFVVASVFIIGMLVADGSRVKRLPRKEKWCYAVLGLAGLYVAFLFVSQAPWPNWPDVLHAVYGGPAESLTRYLKASG